MSSDVDETDSSRSANLYETQDNLPLLTRPDTFKQLDPVGTDHSATKWNRLSAKYNDQYLEIFNGNWKPDEPDEYLETSQYGIVTWTGEEKTKFFEALDRKGRHDLAALAEATGTKSAIEIRDYLSRIEEARDDRQRFSRNAKSVTQPDISSAIEIDADLEDELEDNADALAAFQDFYNYSEARSRDHGVWLINTELANSLSEPEETSGEMEEFDIEENAFLLKFFKFDILLELSRALFMNMGNDSDHDHWHEYAEPDEEPSLTLEAARDLYNIIKSLVLRLLQTAIFLAESRLRATTTPDYVPARILKNTDISAAMEVFNMRPDSSEYWNGFVKKSGLNIVAATHRKGHANVPVTVEQAQLLLDPRRGGRENHISLSQVLGDSPQQHSPHKEVHLDSSEDLDDSVEEVSEVAEDEDSGATGGPDSDNSEQLPDAQSATIAGHAGHRKRRAMVETAEDDFMELQDYRASVQECRSLRAMLGIANDDSDIKLEDLKRPKKLRKLKEDMEDWSDIIYTASWEQDVVSAARDSGVADADPLDYQSSQPVH